MKKLFSSLAIAAGMVALATSTPAAAQLRVWEDYTPQQEVHELTYVKVDEGQLDTYLEGLKSTWVKANEVAKSLGRISDYGIYVVPYGDNDVNLILRITYPNSTVFDPSREEYNRFMQAWGRSNMDSANQTVRDLYNKIRKIQGTHLLREIEIKLD